MDKRKDRNFDDVAEHFDKKVYGSLKGQIRLAVLRKDLHEIVAKLSEQHKRPLRILDVGAGLAQLSLELATLGHEVVINDISKNMLDKAKQSIEDINKLNVHWHTCPYQALDNKLQGKFDLILNHAVLEWLAEPQAFIKFADRWLADGGYLSLCFYNPASFIYRNLMMGNFNIIDKANTQADNKKSLTPNHPVDKDQVAAWLKKNHTIIQVSGLRVFSDYTLSKQGGLANPAAVIDMEVKYSHQEPFKWMGRYLHYLSIKN
ncbi:methyltransferase domain-containing protein [Psychrobacter sp. HD31]|uniref:methyltransferase domain-containing protein n=1 Tax=Psychrobacter sp. HD31 TaxID=3112003 RepID=UPI003DA2ACE2